jgi:hypothetical protein
MESALTRAVVEKPVAEKDPERISQWLSTNIASDLTTRECGVRAKVIGKWDCPIRCTCGSINATRRMHFDQFRAGGVPWQKLIKSK